MWDTAEVRGFSDTCLVPYLQLGWNDKLCLPACDRQAVQSTLLQVVDTCFSLRLGDLLLTMMVDKQDSNIFNRGRG